MDTERLRAFPGGDRYVTAVPVAMDNPLFESYFAETVRRCTLAGVGRIFLCVPRATAPEGHRQRQLALLRRYGPRLKARGFEVGVWFSTLGHGGACDTGENVDDSGFTQMVALDGSHATDSCCPMDEGFIAAVADWCCQLAAAGAQLVLLDDDFRMSFRGGGRFCCCALHRARLEQLLGEPFDADKMQQALISGGPNRWRDAWLQAQGEGLTHFAASLRAALDKTAPGVRLGHCAVLSTWDIDGVDSLTLARTFAGATRPLLRLIGAPYWAALRNFDEINLATVCEYERLQQAWAAGSGVEIFAEGDVYPRPRYVVPAAYLEGLDSVMRAAGGCDGILKYMFDYCASPQYESGYYDRHLRNLGQYRAIHRAFDGRQAVGLTVFEPMRTLAASHAPGPLEGRCPPASLRFVTDNSLPVRYDAGEDATIIFGDAAEFAETAQLAHGAILDAAAARILTRRGFDVGVRAFGETIAPDKERYIAQKETVHVQGGRFVRLQAAEGARILSVLQLEDDEAARRGAPGAFCYQNAAGQRFLVYAFEARYSLPHAADRGLMRGPCRAAQLRSQLTWLAGRAPDALCDPAPDLYMLARRDGRSLSVGLWNFGVDAVFAPRVQLGADWGGLRQGVGVSRLAGRTVTLDTLPPFGFACFTLTAAPTAPAAKKTPALPAARPPRTPPAAKNAPDLLAQLAKELRKKI